MRVSRSLQLGALAVAALVLLVEAAGGALGQGELPAPGTPVPRGGVVRLLQGP